MKECPVPFQPNSGSLHSPLTSFAVVLEMGKLQGVKIDVQHFQENDTVEDMRLEIQRLKEEVRMGEN